MSKHRQPTKYVQNLSLKRFETKNQNNSKTSSIVVPKTVTGNHRTMSKPFPYQIGWVPFLYIQFRFGLF